MSTDGQIGEHSDYIRGIGDGVTAGIRDGIKSGTRKGSRRGIGAGIRDCLARGLVNVGSGGLGTLAQYVAVSDIDISSVRGSLDEAGRAIARQLKARVRDADKVRDAVDGIKERIASELPKNPLARVVSDKAQESLDNGLTDSMAEGQVDMEPEVSEEDAGKALKAARKNMRGAVEEIVAFMVYFIAREATNRATAEASRDLKEKAVRRLGRRLRKLERRLDEGPSKGLDKALNDSIGQLESIVTHESLNETSFIAKVDEAFGSSLADYMVSLVARGMSPAGKALAVGASVVGVSVLIWVIVYLATLSDGDGTPPVVNQPTPTVTRTLEPTPIVPVVTATPIAEPTPRPDLVITYIDADDVGSQTVPEYRVYYYIENVGDVEAGPSTALLMVGGKRHCEDEIGAMGPGKGYEDNFSCTLSESELALLRVCADGFNQVAEIDEDNNCMDYIYQ
jgi:hypothetical protein